MRDVDITPKQRQIMQAMRSMEIEKARKLGEKYNLIM